MHHALPGSRNDADDARPLIVAGHAAAGAAIRVRGVRVEYEPGVAVLDLDELEVGRGERLAVIGPSGSGKTTLLRMINGYVEPARGDVEVLGEPVGRRRGRRRRDLRLKVGFVFQSFNLVERATVFENVLWGRLGRMGPLLSCLGRFSAADRRAAMRAIEEVDLVAQAAQRADTLSGGQQQRVGVARVVAQEAEIILADEPVSNLDPALADDILELLGEVAGRHGVTLVMSLHQPELAVRHGERIVALRQGRRVWDGPAAGFDGAAAARVYGREGGRNRQGGREGLSS